MGSNPALAREKHASAPVDRAAATGYTCLRADVRMIVHQQAT